jgi:hypothetical protein
MQVLQQGDPRGGLRPAYLCSQGSPMSVLTLPPPPVPLLYDLTRYHDVYMTIDRLQIHVHLTKDSSPNFMAIAFAIDVKYSIKLPAYQRQLHTSLYFAFNIVALTVFDTSLNHRPRLRRVTRMRC